MKTPIRHILSFLLTATLPFILASSLSAQPQPNLEVFELKYESSERIVQQLDNDIQSLRAQIEERNQAIAAIKSQEDINYLNRQKLEKLLKESQDLSEQVSALEIRSRAAKERREKAGADLLQLYESEIDRLLSESQKQKLNKARRQALYRQIETLREKQQNLRSTLDIQELQEVKVNELEISPLDSPRKIEQKADLLKDQEEKLRRLSQEIAAYHKELEEELELRNRMGELVADLALFDQQDEVVRQREGTGVASTDQLDFGPGQPNRQLNGETFSLAGQKAFDFESLSVDNLEQLIDQLKKKQQLTVQKADSLAERAKTFYQAAEALRKK